MQYELFIARRYLRAKRQIGLVSVISMIAVAGVTIGVAALICTLAVFNGFGTVVTTMLVGFDPHLRVERADGRPMHGAGHVQDLVRATPGVEGSAPVVNGRLMLVHRNLLRVATVRGVTGSIASASGVTHSIVHGKFDINRADGLPGIVLGVVLADRLHATLGDTVTLVSPVGIEAAATQLAQPLSMRFRITGLYASKNKEYDANFGYAALSAMQTLVDRADDEVDGIDIRCADIDRTNDIAGTLRAALAANPEPLRVQTWYDLHRDLYSVMEMERWVAYVLLCMIIGVAAFTILGSLTMTVIEKQRDISLLKAVGATDRGVARIFIYAGAAIGVIGSATGAALGFAVCWAQQTFHLFKLSSQFIIPALPVEMRAADFVIVCLSAMLLCTLAAAYPARRAFRTIPAEGLRWE